MHIYVVLSIMHFGSSGSNVHVAHVAQLSISSVSGNDILGVEQRNGSTVLKSRLLIYLLKNGFVLEVFDC